MHFTLHSYSVRLELTISDTSLGAQLTAIEGFVGDKQPVLIDDNRALKSELFYS